MEYIYIKTKPGKTIEFMDLLDYNGIYSDYIGYRTIMIHKSYFNLLGKFLDSDFISSVASKIESL